MIRDREALFGAVRHAIDHAQKDILTAIVILQIQGLREISLRFGYHHGDIAQDASCEIIRQSLRPVDKVFHIGGDRFALILPGLRHKNHALLAATRLSQAFEQTLAGAPSPWQGRPIMGMAIYPEHGDSPDQLCRRADMALEEAHRRGEPCAFYQPDATQVEFFYDELHEAISNNRLEVYFQPMWDLQQDVVVGAESLARWTSPVHGPVSPGDFVPFAEQSDLVSSLTRWSINATLRHATALRHVPGLTFAINFSPRVFNRSGMVEQLLSALDIWNMPPTSLVVEVTETALVNDMDVSVRALKRLRDHGIRIAIDDFGAGYASISYLHRLPATEVKIDKSLVLAMKDSERSVKLVRAVIDMAHHLDLGAVAEGIEDASSQQLLTRMGCDFGQGYHLGRPEPATDFIKRFSAEK